MGTIGADWRVIAIQIISCILLIGITGVFIWIVIKIKRGQITPRNPLDIARARYAKGKITLEELRKITKELSED